MERPTKRPRWEPPTTNDQAGPTTQASSSRQEHPHEFTHFGGTGLQNHSGSINVRGNLNIGSPAVLGGSSSHQQSILESLRFDQMDSRHASIKKAFRNTCKWFLQTPVYKEWENKDPSQDENHFLWIKGKPGAGKSTLMKFLYQQMQSRSKKSNDVLISFFFNARGHALEKSTVGLYRSLLVQLLEKQPSLLDKLDTPHQYGNWDVDSLKTLFEQAIQGMGQTSVVCLVDALDECEEDEIREMVGFFTDLVCTENQLSICFASRHYPYITVETGLSIILEKQNEHQDDIAAYLGTALRIGHDQLAEKIRLDLQEKASGVFMWVVLVVDILNKEFDAGRRHTLREKVKQLPANLHELFRDILTRDSNHQDALLLCIQWVLFAKQPLTPKELYFAILSGYEPQYLVDCHSDSISDEDIYKYILNNSKGVVENTKAKIPRVQFIHESVRDFLLKEGGLGQIFPALKVNTHGQSHEALKHCCLTYMNVGTRIETKVEDPTSQTTKQALPFLEYAIAGILHHAEQAENSGVSQSEFLAEFPREEWIVQHNLLQMHKTRRYTPQASLLYILAESDASGLIRAHRSWQSFFKVEDERYGLPILAAMATKSTSAVQTMLKIHGNQSSKFSWAYFQSITPSPLGDFFCSSTRDFNFNKRRETTAELLTHGCEGLLLFLLLADQCDLGSRSSTGRTLLELAIDKGYNIVLKELHQRKDTISTRNKVRQAWLKAKDVAVVKFLLTLGADTSVQNELGETLLFRSIQTKSKRGNEVAKLLIESGADCSIATDQGETPLHWISKNFHSRDMEASIVDLLAESGGTNGLSITDNEGRTPLHHACRNSNSTEVVAMSLIERGADVSATDNKGRTPLHYIAINSSFDSTWLENVGLLIKHGADVSTTDIEGRTPIHYACSNARYYSDIIWELVTLLVQHGADAWITDQKGRTPLDYANEINNIEE
ncbi:hypothetical protein PFICI_06075 [Pestalotiopsis fici W106-1]|uniref:NACHT domain-containing protein n=1 Tax=Pestalotiopsis fici (strain W106-1 / CGMCC3.15140) TaxID=1229662 RepID=W3X4L2_PESFW|nr:uncharacterized protein PFICI_06075 [Pestalotiopsis fici W106-1]ETS81073.1 hypothetical protein PFICI_06075 [Pestalotiopsis fici W106-1]